VDSSRTYSNSQSALGYRAFVDDIHLKELTDLADGTNVGVGWVPQATDATKNMTRSSSRTAYYDPASSRPNLKLLVRYYVSTIQLTGTTATGVYVNSRQDGTRSLVKARKEVILAAGAINTPKILQLSGIGPASVLTAAGVNVVVDLPGVGSNLQDHPMFAISFNCEYS
jgi:choline dehydrogenase-like flavoprotein